ncbi:MAG: tetratricopeptide repeat protein [Gemmatimonadaceae bacterium]|nr:tetratricopeptide repeat protein [Gemmatimonadaceae bacterium]
MRPIPTVNVRRAAMTRAPRAARQALAAIASLLVGACGARTPGASPAAPSVTATLPAGAEAVSLLGQVLRAPAMPTASVDAADAALAANTNDPELLLAAATARATAWRFREAIALYSRGVERWPNDARFLRFRGHRYITVRQFEDGARDLDRAATLDSTNFDIVYHQGLAHFLLGHFDRAAAIYLRCIAFADNAALRAREASGAFRPGYRSCMRMATNDDDRASMTDWAWRSLVRAGRRAEADRLLAPVREAMTINTNRSYYENLLMYKGVRPPEAVLQAASSDSVRFSTSGYAVAHYYLVRGDSARAWALFERVAHGPHWNGFGVIGAEVELARRRAVGR